MSSRRPNNVPLQSTAGSATHTLPRTRSRKATTPGPTQAADIYPLTIDELRRRIEGIQAGIIQRFEQPPRQQSIAPSSAFGSTRLPQPIYDTWLAFPRDESFYTESVFSLTPNANEEWLQYVATSATIPSRNASLRSLPSRDWKEYESYCSTNDSEGSQPSLLVEIGDSDEEPEAQGQKSVSSLARTVQRVFCGRPGMVTPVSPPAPVAMLLPVDGARSTTLPRNFRFCSSASNHPPADTGSEQKTPRRLKLRTSLFKSKNVNFDIQSKPDVEASNTPTDYDCLEGPSRLSKTIRRGSDSDRSASTPILIQAPGHCPEDSQAPSTPSRVSLHELLRNTSLEDIQGLNPDRAKELTTLLREVATDRDAHMVNGNSAANATNINGHKPGDRQARTSNAHPATLEDSQALIFDEHSLGDGVHRKGHISIQNGRAHVNGGHVHGHSPAPEDRQAALPEDRHTPSLAKHEWFQVGELRDSDDEETRRWKKGKMPQKRQEKKG
ncbi:hypothetical protein EK21DRAFT_110565 [Setomelanomma holmii]|uniref:Uncharacterized protein n=1 Tax=Setomelanomma holmii TaxID=210430 RepID=A0A9P4HC31_9PLEO|nr:hypothetical protein EK21DRAFT_110565 [Setomelanomma holmii]